MRSNLEIPIMLSNKTYQHHIIRLKGRILPQMLFTYLMAKSIFLLKISSVLFQPRPIGNIFTDFGTGKIRYNSGSIRGNSLKSITIESESLVSLNSVVH